MALTQISTDGVKDDAVTSGKIPANAVGSSELADNAVDTAAIVDQAVTLDKLPHGTGSNDGKFLRANNGADPSFETVSIPAGTTINNNAADRIITGSGTANTLEGESTFTYDNGGLNIAGNSSRDGLKITQAGSHYGELCFNSNRTGENQAIGYIRGEWDGTEVGAISIEAGDDTTNKDDAKITFYTAQGGTISRKMAIEQDGHVHIDNGDLKFASGHGIDFSDTANGGTGTPNELFDDYEEGSWTPAIEGLSNTPSFHNLGGHYTKIGNRVFLQCHIQINGSNKPQFTNQSSIFKISGLPFTGDNSGAGGGYFGAHGVCVWQQLQWVGGSYSSYGHGDDTQLSPGIVDSGTRISLQTCGQGIYYTGQLLNRALHDNYAPNIEFDMQYRTAT